ncbi:hypothetical protein Smp_158270 [Schistosoma mansoni]|uniref:hypothetical protein n=1 Tax=Schistosoma mansoni TaxID=6183 RepID=UPI0001A62711|nr:hypothetical protein Smp_158270 [Schistosoma mansoni]|eukprot:XP_018645268.1 hypothetical protein Smp_158270 [Schistosoma mansoni]
MKQKARILLLFTFIKEPQELIRINLPPGASWSNDAVATLLPNIMFYILVFKRQFEVKFEWSIVERAIEQELLELFLLHPNQTSYYGRSKPLMRSIVVNRSC